MKDCRGPEPLKFWGTEQLYGLWVAFIRNFTGYSENNLRGKWRSDLVWESRKPSPEEVSFQHIFKG